MDTKATLKALAKAHGCTVASLTEATIAWALSHPEFDAGALDTREKQTPGRKVDVAKQLAKLAAVDPNAVPAEYREVFARLSACFAAE